MRTAPAALLLLIPALACAQYDRPGSTDAQFLKIGVSPRAAAMSDAYIAVVTGAEATYYNAAALPLVQGTDVVFTHTAWFAGVGHEFFAIARSFEDVGAFGLSVTALRTDEMKVRTPLQPEGTGETFYVGNYRFGLSYGRHLTDRVTFGITASYISMQLYKDFSDHAFSLDIATLYTSDFRGFRFGMQISHFGSELKYVNESYPLPTSFTFGAAMNAIQSDDIILLLSFSAIKPNEGAPLGEVGGELGYRQTLFLRGGYRVNHDVATFALGGGVGLDIVGTRIRADYAFNSFRLLGGTHRFGLGVAF